MIIVLSGTANLNSYVSLVQLPPANVDVAVGTECTRLRMGNHLIWRLHLQLTQTSHRPSNLQRRLWYLPILQKPNLPNYVVRWTLERRRQRLLPRRLWRSTHLQRIPRWSRFMGSRMC